MNPFETRKLGKTAVELPQLGFGSAPLGELFVRQQSLDCGHSLVPALSRCHAKSASGLGLTDFQAAATASRHVVITAE